MNGSKFRNETHDFIKCLDDFPEDLLKNDESTRTDLGTPTAQNRLSSLQNASVLYGVRLQQMGQVLFFAGQEFGFSIGARILVSFEFGKILGEVVSILSPEQLSSSFELGEGAIIGLATAQDIAAQTENNLLAAEAVAFCKSCIRQRKLDMKLVDVKVLHDRSKIIFFFTAPTRIDFRELVKDLVRNYRTRIELRQIGVRHEAQMLGGLGNCGMVCCCHRYLRKFAPVTIKMAKEQNLFLNPAKLSGLCGRLLCCLSFEQESYEEFNRRAPKLGKWYKTAEGSFKVYKSNLFSRVLHTINENNIEQSLTLEEWEALKPKRLEGVPDQKKNPAEHKSKDDPSEL